jgi:hypothetical protein
VGVLPAPRARAVLDHIVTQKRTSPSRPAAPRERRSRRRCGLALRNLLLGGLAAAAVVGVLERERRIAEAHAALPAAQYGELDSMRARLVGLEQLAQAHPISRGGFVAARESFPLRLEVHSFQQEESVRGTWLGADVERDLETVSLARRARAVALNGDLEGARELYEQLLEVARPDWDGRQRAERDLRSLSETLEVDA